MKYYSQTKQDEYLDLNIFKKKGKGFFLDIGAHNGITISNTYFFEKHRNWDGICVEPLPEVFKELEKNRSCRTLNVCVGNENKTEKFLQITGYSEMLSGISKNYNPLHLKRIEEELMKYGGEKKEINIESYRISDLLKKYNVKTIDYCSIDVEGSEFEILKTINFDEVDIKVLTIENNYEDNEMRDFMKSNGYELKRRLGADDLYVKRKNRFDFFKKILKIK